MSGSAFVYQGEFGLDEQQFGLLFGAGAVWLIAATQLNPVLLRRWSPQQVLVAGTVAGALAGAALLVLAAHRHRRPARRRRLAVGRAVRLRPGAAERARRSPSRGTARRPAPPRRCSAPSSSASGALVSPVVGLLGNDAVAIGIVVVTALALAIVVLVTVVRPWQLPDTTDDAGRPSRTSTGGVGSRLPAPARLVKRRRTRPRWARHEPLAAERPVPPVVNPWLALPGGRPGPEHARRLRAAHERLVTGTEVADGAVRSSSATPGGAPSAAASTPTAARRPVELLDDDLLAYREAHPLAPVMPVIRRLLVEDAEDDQMIVAVTDAGGRMLWVEGDPRLRSQAAGMHFVEGARWAEDVAGTNAPGTALAVDHAVQIYGSEHYRRPVQPWSCSAAPVHDPVTGAAARRHRRHRRRPRRQPARAHPGAGHGGRRGVGAALAAPREQYVVVEAPCRCCSSS